MLNSKYDRIRELFEKLNIKRHRFKKASFNVYLDGFKKYQSDRDGRTFYEMQDPGLTKKSDRNKLAKLLASPLESFKTSDKKVKKTLNKVKSKNNARQSTKVSQKGVDIPSSIPASQSSAIYDIETSSDILMPHSSHSAASSSQNAQEITEVPLPSSPNLPNSSQSLKELSLPNESQPGMIMRMRRHKFSQDHVYVTDTAVHLGLTSVYMLNDMYSEGDSYENIMKFLESKYSKIRKLREKKEIGLGAFMKPTFKSYLDDENLRLKANNKGLVIGPDEAEDSMQGFVEMDNFETTDEDYTLSDEDDDTAAITPDASDSDDSTVYNIKTGSSDDSTTPVYKSQKSSTNFVFRNKLLNKRNALQGVLPASFYHVFEKKPVRTYSNPKSRSIVHADNGIPRIGVARKIRGGNKPSKAVPEDTIVIPDDISIDNISDNPAYYHKLTKNLDEKTHLNPTIFDIQSSTDDEDDNEQTSVSDDVYDHSDSINNEIDLEGSAEEDPHAGINYMLSRPVHSQKSRRKGDYMHRRKYRRHMTSPVVIHSLPSTKLHNIKRKKRVTNRHHNLSNSLKHPKSFEIVDSDEEPGIKTYQSLSAVTNRKRTTRNNDIYQKKEPPNKFRKRSKTKYPADKNMYGIPSIPGMFYYGRQTIQGTPQIETVQRLEIPVNDKKVKNPVDFDQPRAISEVIPIHASGRKDTFDSITLKRYEELKLKPNSFIYSKLFQECLKLDGEYLQIDSLEFTLLSVNFTIQTFQDCPECPSLLQGLFQTLQSLLISKKGIPKRTITSLRKCMIQLAQLFWALKKSNHSMLTQLEMLLLTFVKQELQFSMNRKLQLLTIPYEMILVNLVAKFLRSENVSIFNEFDTVQSLLERQYVSVFCSIDSQKMYHYLSAGGGTHSMFLESACIFLSICPNPWKYVVDLSSHLKITSILGFLYFCHSKIPTLVDWEYFINRLDLLKNEMQPSKWILVFSSIPKVIKDLSWNFDEAVLLRMYRVLSYRHFENIGSKRHKSLWYSSLPVSIDIAASDGCLDIYVKMLILYVTHFITPNKKASLLEKIVPIASIQTSTIESLRNRANLMLVLSYLFKQNFVGHYKVIMKGFLDYHTDEGYVAASELLFVLCRYYFSQLHTIPIKIIREVLPTIVNYMNEKQNNISSLSESLRNIVDCFINALTSETNQIRKLHQTVVFSSIFLKMKDVNPDSKIIYILHKILDILLKMMLETQPETLERISDSWRDDLISSLKNIILSPNINSDVLKVQCVSAWICISARLHITAGSVAYIQWPYFGTEDLRSYLELPFYTSMLKYYQPRDIEFLQDELLIALIKYLPVPKAKFFDEYFTILSSQDFMKEYIHFKNGLNVSNLTRNDIDIFKQQISVKVLSCIVVHVHKKSSQQKNFNLLLLFIKSLAKQYDIAKKHKSDFNQYRTYAIRMVRYLSTVLDTQLNDIPEFLILKRELSINKLSISLGDELDSMAGVDEIYSLLMNEYIHSLKNEDFSHFQNELVSYGLGGEVFIGTDESNSLIIFLACLVSAHIELLNTLSRSWIHLGNWFSILSTLLCEKPILTKDELVHIIKVLTLMTKVSGTAKYPYTYYEVISVTNVYRILARIDLYLSGFEDRKEFVNSLDTLRGLDSNVVLNVNRNLFLPLASAELKAKVKSIYSENASLLRAVVTPNADPTCLEAKRKEKIRISEKVLAHITSAPNTLCSMPALENFI